tara:strand:+ start:290 stop:940 length:651 start_codon:yes stop_codon:yes gene_type:complete
MELNITVPTKLNEITLGQYKKFIKIAKDNDDVNDVQCKMMQIFCGVTQKDANNMRYSDVEQITGNINELFLLQPPLVMHFYLNNIQYGFIPNLDEMTLGEYIDLDTYSADYDNIEVAMNVLYRPVKKKVLDKYTIEDYNPDNKDKMLDMPMDAVISSLFFFLNLGMELSKITQNSLRKLKPTQLELQKDLQQSMDGIRVWQHSLNTILSELNISLN